MEVVLQGMKHRERMYFMDAVNKGASKLLDGYMDQAINEVGFHPDGLGLVFCVWPDGSKTFEKWTNHTILTIPEDEQRSYLGDYPETTLEEARQAAFPTRVSHLKDRELPPWVCAASKELEETSAIFTVEFCERFIPRLVSVKSTQDIYAAARAAFVETVEAA